MDLVRNTAERWAEYLRLVNNGRFKSTAVKSDRGGESIVLLYCNEAGFWKDDSVDRAVRELEEHVKLTKSFLVLITYHYVL